MRSFRHYAQKYSCAFVHFDDTVPGGPRGSREPMTRSDEPMRPPRWAGRPMGAAMGAAPQELGAVGAVRELRKRTTLARICQ